jgi:hypothetical protein
MMFARIYWLSLRSWLEPASAQYVKLTEPKQTVGRADHDAIPTERCCSESRRSIGSCQLSGAPEAIQSTIF